MCIMAPSPEDIIMKFAKNLLHSSADKVLVWNRDKSGPHSADPTGLWLDLKPLLFIDKSAFLLLG